MRIQLIRITKLKSLKYIDIWELQRGIKELQGRNVECASNMLRLRSLHFPIPYVQPAQFAIFRVPIYNICPFLCVSPSREHNSDFLWFSNRCWQFAMTWMVVSSPVQGGSSHQCVTWLSRGDVTLINT